MKLQYRRGNILDTDLRYIVNECNTQGVFDTELSVMIKQRHPRSFNLYQRAYQQGLIRLGDMQIARCKNKVILNTIVRTRAGFDPSHRFLSYDALSNSMRQIEEYLYGETVAFPLIGIGPSGGDWGVVKAIIRTELKTVQPVIYIPENFELKSDKHR